MTSWIKRWLQIAPTSELHLIRRVFAEYAVKHWKGYAFAIGLMVVTAGCTALSAYLIGSIIDTVYIRRYFPAVLALCLGVVVLFTVKGLAAYGQAVVLAKVGNSITAETQQRIFDKLTQQGLSYFANRHSTDFMAQAVFGAGSFTNVLNVLILALGRDLLSLLGLLIVMVSQEPMLSALGLIVMPAAVLGVRKLIRRVRHIATTQFAGATAILQTMQETVRGFPIIKAFNMEAQMRRRIALDIRSVERASNKMARVSNRSSPLMESLGGISIALVVLYCGYRVLITGEGPGGLISFVTAFLLAYEPAKRIARVNIDVNTSLFMVRMLFDMFDSPASEPDDSDKPALEVDTGRIDFSGVEFGYKVGSPVLRGMTFSAEPGKVTALVGPSGGGKSTTFNLMLRFYDCGRGQIAIDGQDIAGVNRHSLRNQLALVGQDVFLFGGTVRENILCGRPEASNEEVVAAAKAAFAHDFIMSFPLGYDSPVGESGQQLSLGQRQRVALARAFIKDARIVLLDEPTASLDSESEHFVYEAIGRLCAGKTTLVIAHRLNTIRNADCIHVIEGGMIVESGRHQELMAKNGRYATFCRLQFPDQAANRLQDTAA